ncbi:hypothetical protein Q8A67_000006 [Cirrhinus molitorella]|uniref:Uncharacterized protein n=1 Tax=Cirrhinus molitorella TaxID=172907 RepID=A0AA88QBX2_9TELE|nr:hypothetical protein Q8A67_000006 [Cirrhinus molitorella]
MEAVIRSVLPMLDNDQLNELISELTRIGVKTDDDLQYVTADDIKDFLSPIDCRKLIHFLKNRGDSVLHSKKWMLVIEGKYLFPECDLPDVTSAFAVLFASYYVLNLEYQVEAATTLEFIQRFIVRINPENSKCSSKLQLSKRTGNLVRRKTSGLNPHISTFIQEFLDFTWQNY